MIVLDTTVLVYAVGTDHQLRDPCRLIIGAIADGQLHATTTVETVQEFVHVRSRRRSRTEAVERARSYATLLAPLLVTEPDDLEEGLGLYAAHDRLGPFDAVLAAVALRNRADGLVSADTAFSTIDRLHHVDPGSPNIEEALGI